MDKDWLIKNKKTTGAGAARTKALWYAVVSRLFHFVNPYTQISLDEAHSSKYGATYTGDEQ